jgi:hypothetical protein
LGAKLSDYKVWVSNSYNHMPRSTIKQQNRVVRLFHPTADYGLFVFFMILLKISRFLIFMKNTKTYRWNVKTPLLGVIIAVCFNNFVWNFYC